MSSNDVPVFIDHNNPPQEGKQTIERDTVQCIVKHWKEEKYLGLKWKDYAWQTFIIGGVEAGEDPVTAGIREIKEETGFTNPKFVRKLGGMVQSKYFAAHKDVNRIANVQGLYFELQNNETVPISEEDKGKYDLVWLSREEMPKFVKGGEVHELWSRLMQNSN